MEGLLFDIVGALPGVPGLQPGTPAQHGPQASGFAQQLVSAHALQVIGTIGALEPTVQPVDATGSALLAPVQPVVLLAQPGSRGSRLPEGGNALPLTPPAVMPDSASAWIATQPSTRLVVDSVTVDWPGATDMDEPTGPTPDLDTGSGIAPVHTALSGVLPVPDAATPALPPSYGLRAAGERAATQTPSSAGEPVRSAPQVDPAPDPLSSLPQTVAARPTTGRTTTPTETVGPAASIDPLQGDFDASLRGPIATAPAPTSAATRAEVQAPSVLVSEPVGSRPWQDAIGRQLGAMVDRGAGRAEIRLDPPELGPIDIRLSVRDDKAVVAFQAPSGTTRDALESAMPRLREMLAEQGITLDGASVSDQAPDKHRARSDPTATGPGTPGDGQDDAAERRAPDRAPTGLVDLYA